MRGYIYLLLGANLPGRPIKIGKAKTRDRYKAYSITTPIKSVILFDIEVNDYDEVEKGLHGLLFERRLEGEWFNLGVEEIGFVMDALVQIAVGDRISEQVCDDEMEAKLEYDPEFIDACLEKLKNDLIEWDRFWGSVA